MQEEHGLSEAKLKELYLDKKLSINQIAKKFDYSYWYIWKSMKIFGIKARSLSEANTMGWLERKVVISEKELKELYLNKRLSVLKIAKLYNCHHSVILDRLNENQIETRDSVEANTKYIKKDFDGTEEDKAYMLGFALGDLNVRKINKNGRTIVIQGASTIPEQIELIKGLFENYGSVRVEDFKNKLVNEKRAVVNLNDSFNFLLYKQDKIPDYILAGESTFFAFLAGYIDAEGYLTAKKPFLMVINSYDKVILNQIYENCVRYGLNCPKPRIAARKGYTSLKKIIPYRKDMWQFGVYSKKSLFELYNKIYPYLKHKNRINKVEIVRNSILLSYGETNVHK